MFEDFKNETQDDSRPTNEEYLKLLHTNHEYNSPSKIKDNDRNSGAISLEPNDVKKLMADMERFRKDSYTAMPVVQKNIAK